MCASQTELPEFGSLTLNENPTGWGPLDIPDEFKDIPYQPFAKDQRLGRVADWSGNGVQDMKNKGRYVTHFMGSQYTYYHDEDDSNFMLVTSARDTKVPFRQQFRFPMRGRRVGGLGPGYPYQTGRGAYGGMNAQGNFGNRKVRNQNDRDRAMLQNRRWQQWGPGSGGGGGKMRGAQNAGGWRSNAGNWGANQDRRQNQRTLRESSVQIKDDWTLVEELDFARLSKLALPNVKEGEDVVNCGEMEYYDKSYDRVSTRNERPLTRVNRVVHTVNTTNDPIIRRLAKECIGRVYCTDSIAAKIMCCTRSVYPWDLLIIRTGDVIFFDERQNADIDLLTVCETAAEPPSEETGHMNSPHLLSLEATFINTNLCQQMLQMGGKKFSFPEKNPFIEEDEDSDDDDDDSTDDSANEDSADETKTTKPKSGEKKKKPELASVGYRYRLFDLGNETNFLVRCEVSGVLPPNPSDESNSQTSPQFVCIRALNEFDSRYCGSLDWRTKLDAQRGAVLAAEIKNNACKLSRWAVSSILSGADQLKIGFVSRVNPKDSSKHVILGTQQFRPLEFASQLNLNLDNSWGILRCVIDFCMKMPEGKYLMLKDPNKPVLRIYSLPTGAFDSDEGEESGDNMPPRPVQEQSQDNAPRSQNAETRDSSDPKESTDPKPADIPSGAD